MNWESWKGRARQIKARAAQAKAGAAGRAKKIRLPGWLSTAGQTAAVAFGMFSAVPAPQPAWNEKNMKYALCAFPLVGVVIALAFGCWGWAAAALDLPVLRRCLEELYRDGVCEAPVFDFRLQRPNGSQQIDCRDGVVIIEGLHALNPALTENLPADAVFCLYAGLREEYAGPDGSRFLATRDIRLARRVVRDYLFRGHGPSFTLGLWGHVCAGEDRFIKPYKPRADLLLDTTHTYEVCLWRNVLDSMPPDPDLTETQRRQLEALCGKFAVFPALDPALVPQNSMLREFIGTQNA